MGSLFRTLSLPYWRRHRVRAVLVAAGIGLGVATWVATGALNRTLEQASRRAATPLAGAADLYVSNGDVGLRRDLAEALAAVPGVRAVRPLVIQRIVLPDLNRQPALLLGIDLDARPGDEPAWKVKVNDLGSRSYVRSIFLRQRPVLVGEELEKSLPRDVAQFNVLVAGQTQRLVRTGSIEAHGPAAALGGNVVVLECDAAAGLVGRPDLVSRLDVSLEPGADREAVRRRLDGELAGKGQVGDPEGHDRRVQDMLTGLKVAFSLCGAGALVVGLFLVNNALAVGVAERRRDIGILRALGATRGQVGRLFLGEAALLGLAGVVLGIPLGLGLARLSLGPMQGILSDVFLPVQAERLQVPVATLLGAAAAGLTTALLAALAPSLRAAAERPSEAMGRLVPVRGSAPFRVQVAGGLGLVALSLACQGLQDRLPARVGTFGSLVLMVLAALLLTPFLTSLAARLLQPLARWLLGVPGRLAADNLARARGRTGVVIAALAAGVALLVQTGGLIRSNEDAIRAWVDRSIAGDLFVTAGGPLSASGRTLPMAEALGERLWRAFPQVRVVPMRFRYLDWDRDGHASRVLLLALDAPRYYAANKDRSPPLPDLELYRRLAEPGTVLVSENFAALHGVRAGQTITLPGTDGPVPLRVLGTVADYSCNRGTAIVDRSHYRRQFDAGLIDVFDAYLDPGADAEAVRRRVQQSPLAAEQGLCVLTRGELRGHILGMVGRLYGLAYTQEVVVGIVALLGVVTALLISVRRRRRELGLLRAVGATRAQVLRSVVAEAVLLGAVGTGLGLLAGLPLEWYTVRVLLFQESGFLCPVRFPWLTAGVVAGLTVVAAAVAGLGPALQAVRANVAAAVAYE
jgi:putative ABC transport system permease protein